MRMLLTLLMLTATTVATAAEFTPPPPFIAVYELEKGPLTLAEARVQFERPELGRYRYRMHTYPVGMARLFYGGEIRESSIGRITEDGFQPERYTYRRTGDDRAREARLEFDWHTGQVTNHVGDHPWRLDIPEGTIDRVIGPLQLMHDLAELDGARTITYRIADGGKLKEYTASVEDMETVRTPAGRFEARKVVRRAADGESTTTLWSAPALRNLVVRIRRWDEDDGTFDLRLKSIRGIEREARG